jgi:hypothetical protein
MLRTTFRPASTPAGTKRRIAVLPHSCLGEEVGGSGTALFGAAAGQPKSLATL